MKPRNLYRIVTGAVLLAGGAGALLITGGNGIAATLFLCAGLAFLITGIVRHRRYGDDPESDERSKKIGAYGLSCAWLTGLFFMFALFWLDYGNVFTLSVQDTLMLSIFVLAFSAMVFQVWFFRKGDVA